MSKLQEKIDLYTSEAEKLDIAIDADLFKNVAKGLGPSIYKEDAELVSSSNKAELETIKKNFLINKLGQEDNEKLDEAIQKVIDTLGSSNRRKYRALFYYLLVKELGAESAYEVVEDDKEEEKPAAKEETKEVKAEKAEPKEEIKPKKEKVVEEKVAEEKAVEKPVVEAPVVEADVVEETEEQVDPETFLKEFDWEKYEEGIEAVEEEKLKE